MMHSPHHLSLSKLTLQPPPRYSSLRIFASMQPKMHGESSSDAAPHVAICGAGVIGACTAYYLSQKGFRVTVIEKSQVACSASGKAGGFLALDWSSGHVGKLASLSYRLHEQLAENLQCDYGYRKVDTLSVEISEKTPKKQKLQTDIPGWIDGPASNCSVIGTPSTTAQVHPKLFTEAVTSAAIDRYGAVLVSGEVQGIALSNNKVTGVVVDGKTILADAAVIAMGPWSNKVKLLSQITKISGLKANSIVLKPKPAAGPLISAHMLFLNYETIKGKRMEPEVYPRPNGDVYICGMSEEVDLPDDPEDVAPSEGAPAFLRQVAATVSSHLCDMDCAVEQACFLPCSEDGLPVIGPIPDAEGAYVATGHSCWGILMAPATGLALAELIADGKSTCVNIKPFSPNRFLKKIF